MPDIVGRVSNFMQAQGMPVAGSTILVALSGGADSVALALLLSELGYVVVAAHCNFGLRPEADAEEEWVRRFAEAHGISLLVQRFTATDFASLEADGIQQAARKLRYAFFEDCLALQGLTHCATAHHADDQLETQVLSFFRGNDRRLLKSIPPIRGPYFRPLLTRTKSELIAWLEARHQDWCHDSSNDKDIYLRNKVRNQLLPLLEETFPGFRGRFTRQAERYAAQQAWIAASFEAVLPAVEASTATETVLDLSACAARLGAAHVGVFVDWWLDRQGFSGTQIEEILRLQQADTGASVQLGEWQVLRDRDTLRLRKHAESGTAVPLVVDLNFREELEIHFAGDRITLKTVPLPIDFQSRDTIERHWLDLDSLRPPLCLRIWRQGDRIQPYGLKGSKLVSDILIDQKRDRFAKESCWILEDAEGIVLVSGYRIAARVALQATSTHCLQLERTQSV